VRLSAGAFGAARGDAWHWVTDGSATGDGPNFATAWPVLL
jgi:hypothetical protein